jgi:hypothetical protein
LTETEAATRKSVAFIWVLLGIFVIFLAGGLAFAFLFQHPQQPEQVYTAPTDTPAPIKPEAPAAAQWKIEVLNGSGVPGAAAKVASRLELLGYTILKTGNTDATPAKTTFYLSKEFSPYADDFVSSLAKEKITAVNGGELTGSTASAQIIIGAE